MIERTEESAGRRAAWGLAGVAALAVSLRIAAVFAVGSYKLDRVTYEHGEIARNLVEGRGFSVRWLGAEGPTSQQAPVYPSLVAVFYFVLGVETPAALLALQLFQAALGGLLAAATTQLGRELLPDCRPAAWLAGVGAATYPTLVYAVTQVQVASLAALLVVSVLSIAARAARTRSTLCVCLGGLAAGLVVLTDPILSLVVFVALLMLRRPHALDQAIPVTHHDSHIARRPRFEPALLMACVCAAVVAPWIVRNSRVHGELVFVKSTFGYAFWQGNHSRSFGTDKIPAAAVDANETLSTLTPSEFERQLWQARHGQTFYIDDLVLSPERVVELGKLSEPARSRRLLAESVAYIREHPTHYARLCLQRLRFFLLFDETNPKSRVLAYRVSHVALLVLSVAGVWLTRGDARRFWPTYLTFALMTTFHVLTIVSVRFRIPLEPIQLLWSASGVAAVARVVNTAARCVAARHAPARGFCSGVAAGTVLKSGS